MDPKACLTWADQAISDGDLDAARYALNDYANWRSRGGFEPIEVAGTLLHGDAFASECQRRLEDARRQAADNYDPTPYCSGCGAMRKDACHCGPRAAND